MKNIFVVSAVFPLGDNFNRTRQIAESTPSEKNGYLEKDANVPAAKEALLHRIACNRAARCGEYSDAINNL